MHVLKRESSSSATSSCHSCTLSHQQPDHLLPGTFRLAAQSAVSMAAELRVPLYDVERDSTPTLVAVTGVTGAFPAVTTAGVGEGDGEREGQESPQLSSSEAFFRECVMQTEHRALQVQYLL